MKIRVSLTIVLLITAVLALAALAGDSDEFSYLPYIARPQNTATPTSTPTITSSPTNTPTQAATHTPSPTNTSQPTNTPTPSLTPTVSPSDIRLTFIEYNPPGDDVDGEFVRLQNFGGGAQNMTGWTLSDADAHVYAFPAGFTLQPGALVQVWTKAGQNTATNLYWGSAASIWTNTGDTAYLYNGAVLVDTCSYAGGGQNTGC